MHTELLRLEEAAHVMHYELQHIRRKEEMMRDINGTCVCIFLFFFLLVWARVRVCVHVYVYTLLYMYVGNIGREKIMYPDETRACVFACDSPLCVQKRQTPWWHF